MKKHGLCFESESEAYFFKYFDFESFLFRAFYTPEKVTLTKRQTLELRTQDEPPIGACHK